MKVQYIEVEVPVFMEDGEKPMDPSNDKALRDWVVICVNGGGFQVKSADRVEDAHMG